MFLIDTGADCAVVPRRLAQQVGLTWSSLPPAQVVGVGPGGVSTRVGPLRGYPEIWIGKEYRFIRWLAHTPAAEECANMIRRFLPEKYSLDLTDEQWPL